MTLFTYPSRMHSHGISPCTIMYHYDKTSLPIEIYVFSTKSQINIKIEISQFT